MFGYVGATPFPGLKYQRRYLERLPLTLPPDNGYELVWSFKLFPYSWADVAMGRGDAEIENLLAQAKARGTPSLGSFHHEPEDDRIKGTPEEFVAAFQRFVQLKRKMKVPNVRIYVCLMSYTFRQAAAGKPGFDPLAWYPGDQWCSILAADCYVACGCRDNQGIGKIPPDPPTWAKLWEPVQAFADAHGKSTFVPEFGIATGIDPALRSSLIEGAVQTMQAQTLGGCYFNMDVRPAGCDWRLGSEAAAYKQAVGL